MIRLLQEFFAAKTIIALATIASGMLGAEVITPTFIDLLLDIGVCIIIWVMVRTAAK